MAMKKIETDIVKATQHDPGLRQMLKGDQGDRGEQGKRGKIGIGRRGPTGATGLQGATGVQGATGMQGPRGATGPRGHKGSSGGALQIERDLIVTFFNEKSIWRGQYRMNDIKAIYVNSMSYG